jgi:hypothetical protein
MQIPTPDMDWHLQLEHGARLLQALVLSRKMRSW